MPEICSNSCTYECLPAQKDCLQRPLPEQRSAAAQMASWAAHTLSLLPLPLSCVIVMYWSCFRFDGPEPGGLWGLGAGEEVLVRPPATSMAFSDFVRLLREEGIKETFYLEYLALHQYLGAALAVRAFLLVGCVGLIRGGVCALE